MGNSQNTNLTQDNISRLTKETESISYSSYNS